MDQLVVRRLGLAIIKLRTEFEMSTITYNEDRKVNAKCKKFRSEPPFGGLRGNAQWFDVWLDGKRIVDLVIIELFR